MSTRARRPPATSWRSSTTTEAQGFEFSSRKSGEVVITHHGRVAATLRGDRATKFLERLRRLDGAGRQGLMARVTGNYKRGNEGR